MFTGAVGVIGGLAKVASTLIEMRSLLKQTTMGNAVVEGTQERIKGLFQLAVTYFYQAQPKEQMQHFEEISFIGTLIEKPTETLGLIEKVSSLISSMLPNGSSFSPKTTSRALPPSAHEGISNNLLQYWVTEVENNFVYYQSAGAEDKYLYQLYMPKVMLVFVLREWLRQGGDLKFLPDVFKQPGMNSLALEPLPEVIDLISQSKETTILPTKLFSAIAKSVLETARPLCAKIETRFSFTRETVRAEGERLPERKRGPIGAGAGSAGAGSAGAAAAREAEHKGEADAGLPLRTSQPEGDKLTPQQPAKHVQSSQQAQTPPQDLKLDDDDEWVTIGIGSEDLTWESFGENYLGAFEFVKALPVVKQQQQLLELIEKAIQTKQHIITALALEVVIDARAREQLIGKVDAAHLMAEMRKISFPQEIQLLMIGMIQDLKLRHEEFAKFANKAMKLNQPIWACKVVIQRTVSAELRKEIFQKISLEDLSKVVQDLLCCENFHEVFLIVNSRPCKTADEIKWQRDKLNLLFDDLKDVGKEGLIPEYLKLIENETIRKELAAEFLMVDAPAQPVKEAPAKRGSPERKGEASSLPEWERLLFENNDPAKALIAIQEGPQSVGHLYHLCKGLIAKGECWFALKVSSLIQDKEMRQRVIGKMPQPKVIAEVDATILHLNPKIAKWDEILSYIDIISDIAIKQVRYERLAELARKYKEPNCLINIVIRKIPNKKRAEFLASVPVAILSSAVDHFVKVGALKAAFLVANYATWNSDQDKLNSLKVIFSEMKSKKSQSFDKCLIQVDSKFQATLKAL